MVARGSSTVLFVAAVLCAQPTPGRNSFYRSDIQPLLATNCLACHNAKVKQGGLDLSTREGLLKGSEHGPVVVPGNPDDSELYKLGRPCERTGNALQRQEAAR